jgi:hypothetical protein
MLLDEPTPQAIPDVMVEATEDRAGSCAEAFAAARTGRGAGARSTPKKAFGRDFVKHRASREFDDGRASRSRCLREMSARLRSRRRRFPVPKRVRHSS